MFSVPVLEITLILPFFRGEIRLEKYHRLADLLLELEMVLRKTDLWEMDVPSEQDLTSQEPFCIDTMNFLQWLKFILLPTFKSMIESHASLPSQCNISPMAEEYLVSGLVKGSESVAIVHVIQSIDTLLSAGSK